MLLYLIGEFVKAKLSSRNVPICSVVSRVMREDTHLRVVLCGCSAGIGGGIHQHSTRVMRTESTTSKKRKLPLQKKKPSRAC